jgi:hypothetical protein
VNGSDDEMPRRRQIDNADQLCGVINARSLSVLDFRKNRPLEKIFLGNGLKIA